MTAEENLVKFVDFVTQAVETDITEDYEKAIQLYEHAVVFFLDACDSVENEYVKEGLMKKCTDRANRLKNYLKSKEDNSEQNATMPNAPIFNQGIESITRAVEEDKKYNYKEALLLYKLGVVSLVTAIEEEEVKGKVVESIRTKCILYLDRAEKIKKYLIDKESRVTREENIRKSRPGKFKTFVLRTCCCISSSDLENLYFV